MTPDTQAPTPTEDALAAIRARLEAADDPIKFEATFLGTPAQNEANAHFLSHSMADIRFLLAALAAHEQADAPAEGGSEL